MRIGIDGRELLNRQTGVGRYLASLCSEWLKLKDNRGFEFIIYTPTTSAKLSVLGPPFKFAQQGLFRHQPVQGNSGTWWEQALLPDVANRDSLDLFFGPAYSVPLRLKVPSVVTMHDVSFASHPEWFRWKEGTRRRWLAQQTLSIANKIIADSNFSKDEIIRHFDVPASRIHVVWPGIKARPRASNTTANNLVLYVGSLFTRRNLPTLIKVFNKVTSEIQDAKLVIVGENRTYPLQDLRAIIEQEGLREKVRLVDYVSDNELSDFYQRASVFVFLSEYEGFGFTPLEALAARVPIVVADTPVAREVYGNTASFVNVTDISGTAKAIVSLVNDEELRTKKKIRAETHLTRFSWERSARETLKILEAAAKMPQ